MPPQDAIDHIRLACSGGLSLLDIDRLSDLLPPKLPQLLAYADGEDVRRVDAPVDCLQLPVNTPWLVPQLLGFSREIARHAQVEVSI